MWFGPLVTEVTQRAGVSLNVFNMSFYVCKSVSIHGNLTVSLNSLGDEVSVPVQLKQDLVSDNRPGTSIALS